MGVFGECSCSEGCAHYTLALHDGADAEGEAGGGKGALEVARKHGATLASVGEQKCVVFSPAGDRSYNPRTPKPAALRTRLHNWLLGFRLRV